jgi:class III poly(R)-hydroxyalkanoic acid synthase PhaE subunit
VGANVTRQWLAQVEQSLGVARSMWELFGKSAALGDVPQRVAAFNNGLQQLQAQCSQLFAAMPGQQLPGFQPSAAFNPMAMFQGLIPPGLFAGGVGAAPWASLPSMGPAREYQDMLTRLGQMSTRYFEAQSALQNQWSGVMNKALQDWGTKLTPALHAGQSSASLRELYDQWVDVAEKAYGGAARGDVFAKAQADVTNALSQLRIAQRDFIEEWCKALDLPTRSELNSVHQQLRQLKDSLQKLGGQVSPGI